MVVRRRGESVISFLATHRSLLARMKREGIEIDQEQVAYYLKKKLNLNGTQLQLLETALVPEPTPEDLEAQATR